jgi:hypothetical protein
MQSGRNIQKKRLTFYKSNTKILSKYKEDCCESDEDISRCYDNRFYNDRECNDDVCNDRECHCYKRKILNLVVSLDSKVGHPWVNRIKGDLCFVVDGVKGPPLFLQRGYTYNFHLEGLNNGNTKHTFYFTSDPLGGSKINPIILPRSSYSSANVISLYVSQLLPKTFFYQSICDTAMGGVIVIEEPEYCCSEEKEKEIVTSSLAIANDGANGRSVV